MYGVFSKCLEKMNQKFNNYLIFALFKITSCIALPQSTATTRCGAGFDGITCANNPDGTCCSQYGYCGYSEEYCSPLQNCQSGCWSLSTTYTYVIKPTASAVAATSAATAVNTTNNTGGNNSDLLYKILVPVALVFVILLSFLFVLYKLRKRDRERDD
ncbi:6638_t:CDS:1, partial [Cetraspora pellucida]